MWWTTETNGEGKSEKSMLMAWHDDDNWLDYLKPQDYKNWLGGARGVMVIVIRNGHGDTSSNPGWDWLHFT